MQVDGSNDVLTFAERGFPYSTFPSGWFQVGWSGDLAAGGVVPLRFFGTDLVMFRTEEGQAVVLDGVCAHFGAHLGYGGSVDGDCIECPFHGWRWGRDGVLVEVPYSDRTPRVSIRSWPTREHSGIIFVWHDHLGSDPTWEPPVIAEEADPDYHDGFPDGAKAGVVYLHPQFAAENLPDMVHMKTVHKWLDVPEPEFLDLETPIARTSFLGRISTPRGPVEVHNEGIVCGLGFNIARITGMIASCTIGAFTPIDDRSSMCFVTVWVPKRSADEEAPTGLAAATIRANHEQLFGNDYDRPIFEHLRYRTRPLLMPEESEHRRFRQWARQFYPAEADCSPE